jgi:hypothetical protein
MATAKFPTRDLSSSHVQRYARLHLRPRTLQRFVVYTAGLYLESGVLRATRAYSQSDTLSTKNEGKPPW